VRSRFSGSNVRILIQYEWLETLHNYLHGNWQAIANYDNELINKSLNQGRVYDVSQYLYWHGFPTIYKGSLHDAESVVRNLRDIYEEYSNPLAISCKYELNTNLLIECWKLADALIEIEEGIGFVQDVFHEYGLIEMYSCQALIHILMKDMEKAEISLQNANRVRLGLEAPVPTQLSSFYRSRLEYDLCQLSHAMKNGFKSKLSTYRREAGISNKMMLKLSRKCARYRVESFRLAGRYYWLVNRKKKALQWWTLGIQEGERLGARLQLSRVYLEAGKHLLEAEKNQPSLNMLDGPTCLQRAGILFHEMNLQRDLADLNHLLNSQAGLC